MKRKRFKTKLSRAQRRKNVIVIFAVVVCAYIFVLLFGRGIGLYDELDAEVLLLMLALCFSILSMLLFPIMIIACVLGAQKGRAKRIRDDSSFVAAQGLDFYRDILSGVSPATVSLLMDLDLYGKKDIAATLLRMYRKGAINFQGKGLVIATGKNKRELDRGELNLLNIAKKGLLSNKNALARWKQNRLRDAEMSGYIKKKENVNRHETAGKYLAVALVLTVVAIVLWGYFLANDMFIIESVIDLMIAIFYLLFTDAIMFTPWYLAVRERTYYRRGDILYERTPLGNEMAEKIAGLAAFIKEFSLLSEADKEQVVLWDDYLPYAIVLEENEKIVNDICKLYNINLRNLAAFKSFGI